MKMSNNMNQLPYILRKKKAQVGGTLTWFVATMIIVVILLIAIYAASILGKTKYLDFSSDKKLKDSKENWVDTKSELAFGKNSTNKDRIQEWLNNKTLSEDS